MFMETTLFIARVIAVMYLAIGLGILLSPDYYRKTFDAMLKNSGIMYLGGFLALIVGYLIVAYHNIWVKDWTVIITIFGWAALIKGVLILAFPQGMVDFSASFLKKKNFTIIGFGVLVIGAILGYFGFFM